MPESSKKKIGMADRQVEGVGNDHGNVPGVPRQNCFIPPADLERPGKNVPIAKLVYKKG